MMIRLKYLSSLSLLIVGILAKGQSLVFNKFDLDSKGNIKSIIEKSVKYPDDWREFEFDSLHRLKEKRYFRGNNLVQTEDWNYIDNDSIVMKKLQIGDKNYVYKYYFDSNKKIKRYEVSPEIVFTNFVFDGDDVVQYNKISFNGKDTTAIELYETEYNKNKRIAITKSSGNEIQTRKYDKKGNLISEIIDFNNPEIFLGGVKTWSRHKHDKYRIDYKYDKYGNWIKKYAVTWLKKYKIEVRIIEYN